MQVLDSPELHRWQIPCVDLLSDEEGAQPAAAASSCDCVAQPMSAPVGMPSEDSLPDARSLAGDERNVCDLPSGSDESLSFTDPCDSPPHRMQKIRRLCKREKEEISSWTSVASQPAPQSPCVDNAVDKSWLLTPVIANSSHGFTPLSGPG